MSEISKTEQEAIDSLEKKVAEEAENDKRRKRKRAVIAAIVFGSLFLIALTVLLVKLSKDDGWRDVTVRPGSEANCSGSFSFRMKLDRAEGGRDYQLLTQAYTDATIREYGIFDANDPHVGIVGLYALNTSNGETLTVEPELYKALETLEKSGFRGLYLGPVYEVYQELFVSEDDVYAAASDPARNEETAAFVREVIRFASDPDEISIELLGNNRVKLHVSDAYRAFAAEYEITRYLDFFWMKNAFILDDLKEKLTATGYTKGYLVSEEGFILCLDETDELYEMVFRDRNGELVTSAAALRYRGPITIVSLHDYAMTDTYEDYYYLYEDGTLVTPYIDPQDGLYKSSIHDVVLYSGTAGAAELLLAGADLLIADSFDAEKAAEYAKNGCYSIYCRDKEIVIFGNGFQKITAGTGYTVTQK